MTSKVRPEVEATIVRVDYAGQQMRKALDDLGALWRRGGHTLDEIRAMRAANRRARRNAR